MSRIYELNEKKDGYYFKFRDTTSFKLVYDKDEKYSSYHKCHYVLDDDDQGNIDIPVLFKDATAIDLVENTCLRSTYYPPNYEFNSGIALWKKSSKSYLELSVDFVFEDWEYPLDIRQYSKVLSKKINEETDYLYTEDRDISEGFIFGQIRCEIKDNKTIGSLINDIISLLQDFHKIIIKSYKQVPELFAQFSLPEDSIHIYSQYLMYFGQFLKDMNIASTTSVETEENLATLAVIPKGKTQNLEDIYSALAIYLGFPTNSSIIKPKLDIVSKVKYQQLISMVQHLESQLKLSEALVSIKQEEIKLLKMTKVSTSVNKKNVWEPLSGVKINKAYTSKYFEIDFGKLLKLLKKKNN
ncbi:hypothetical protein GQR58_010620 [Nymphon striatum]|nr:hypothetical protein GQR58_010620 [Nymphon striatum]